jgi:autotransporter-associated beta strand protein
MRFSSILATGFLVVAAISQANAQTLYWDIDGANPGAGSATPCGVWGTGATANWSLSMDGDDIAPSLWTDNADAILTAGSDATGTYTVTLTGTVNANNIKIEEGTVLFSTGTLDLTGAGGIFDVATGASGSFAGTPTLGGTVGITKNGDDIVILGGANTDDGSTTINSGMTFRVCAAVAIPDTSVVNTAASSSTFDVATSSVSETVNSIDGTKPKNNTRTSTALSRRDSYERTTPISLLDGIK